MFSNYCSANVFQWNTTIHVPDTSGNGNNGVAPPCNDIALSGNAQNRKFCSLSLNCLPMCVKSPNKYISGSIEEGHSRNPDIMLGKWFLNVFFIWFGLSEPNPTNLPLSHIWSTDWFTSVWFLWFEKCLTENVEMRSDKRCFTLGQRKLCVFIPPLSWLDG